MTLYIIDAARSLPPTWDENDHALDLSDGDGVILAAGASIAAYGTGAYGIAGALGCTFVIDGAVTSRASTGIATHGWVRVGASGTVTGGDHGVLLAADTLHQRVNTLSNEGSITGAAIGVTLEGARTSVTIANAGKISGSIGVFAGGNGDPGASFNLTNTGLISSSQDGFAILGLGLNPNLVVNRGRIEGTVGLGMHNDIYDGRGGSVTGAVFLFQGDDVAYGGDGSETFFASTGTDFIDGGAGEDTLLLASNNLGTHIAHTVDLGVTERQETGTNSRITLRQVENLTGGNFIDTFRGNDEANALSGNFGNDFLDGRAGNDLLIGGTGADMLTGGEGSDVAVFTGARDEYTLRFDADGSVHVTDLVTGRDGADQLRGVEFAHFGGVLVELKLPVQDSPSDPAGNPPPDNPPAKPLDLVLKGSRKADVLIGGAGHDRLLGYQGRDKLTGGEGQDTFVFGTRLARDNVDALTDFRSADDTFQLAKSVFARISRGILEPDAFHKGTAARDAEDRILYNAKTGVLSYDADGVGSAHGAVAFAKVKPWTVVKAADFFVI